MRKISTLGFIFDVSRRCVTWLIILITLSFSWAFATTMYSFLFGSIVDSAKGTMFGDPADLVFYPMLYFFLLQCAQICLYRLGDWADAYYPPLLKKVVSARLFVQLTGQSASFFSENYFGALANKVSDVVSGTTDVVKLVIERLFASAMLLILTVLFLARIGIGFAIAMAIWISFFLILTILLVIRNQSLAKEAARARALLTGNIVDVLANISSVRNFCTTAPELDYHTRLVDEHIFRDRKRDFFIIKIYAVQGFSFLAFQAFSIWLLMRGYSSSELTIGAFVKVLQLNGCIISSFWSISRDIRNIWERLSNIGHALDVIFAEKSIRDCAKPVQLLATRGEITFEQVRFQYPKADPIFENKTIVIPSGQKVGLVGYSGSGKSTFASLILRTYDPSSGRILIDGHDLRNLTQDSLRRSIAVIPQNPLLFNRTIFQNISYGRPEASVDEVLKASMAAGVDEFAPRMPGGYDFVVGEQGSLLSGGQRQRVAIARAMLKDAPILIFDEATSQLDSVSQAFVQKSITSMAVGRTCIFIAHRLTTLVRMDRILVFFNGKIVQDGPHKELLATPGLYQTLWETQNL